MKIKDGFVLEEVGGSYIAVALGAQAENFRGFIKMNSTGVFLWELMQKKDMSEEELVKALLEKYEVSEQIARADVQMLCSKLAESGIVE